MESFFINGPLKTFQVSNFQINCGLLILTKNRPVQVNYKDTRATYIAIPMYLNSWPGADIYLLRLISWIHSQLKFYIWQGKLPDIIQNVLNRYLLATTNFMDS